VDQHLSELGESLKALLKQLKAQEKAISDMLAASREANGRDLQAALARLNGELLERVGLGQTSNAAVTSARERLDQLRMELRRSLIRELESACTEAERPFRRLGDSPPELLLAPFTVTLDMSALEAVVSYARQDMVRVEADAGAILKAVEREEKALSKGQPPPEKLFQELLAAYSGLLGRSGRAIGTRIDLVEILPELALLRQGSGFRSNPVRERFSTFSKAHFLFALARLRATRILEQDGYRLDLGTATGDSVRSKSRVFFIQDANGQGQYYLSLRFIRHQSSP
jgi:hypothetical protein